MPLPCHRAEDSLAPSAHFPAPLNPDPYASLEETAPARQEAYEQALGACLVGRYQLSKNNSFLSKIPDNPIVIGKRTDYPDPDIILMFRLRA